MPAVPYTIVLYAVTNASGPFPMTLPAPTQGTTWIIRDISFFLPSTAGTFPIASQATLNVSQNQIASTPAYRTLRNVLYRFSDVRQAVTTATEVEFNAGQLGWNLQVTGYAFT